MGDFIGLLPCMTFVFFIFLTFSLFITLRLVRHTIDQIHLIIFSFVFFPLNSHELSPFSDIPLFVLPLPISLFFLHNFTISLFLITWTQGLIQIFQPCKHPFFSFIVLLLIVHVSLKKVILRFEINLVKNDTTFIISTGRKYFKQAQ